MHTNRAWYRRQNPVVNRAARRNAARFESYAAAVNSAAKKEIKNARDRARRAAAKVAA